MAAAAAFAGARSALDRAGLNLLGVLGVARYDAEVPAAWRADNCLPAARSAVVVAAGGRALFRAFRAAGRSTAGSDPLDQYVRSVVDAAARPLAARALYAYERRGGSFADFVALGRAAGLGSPSRLGLLLQPEFGPWMSIRAVLLTPLALPEDAPLADFKPCHDCPAPCASACPGSALARSRFDVLRCAAVRQSEPGCALRCAARRACVIAPEHGYDEVAEAHHMRAAALDKFD